MYTFLIDWKLPRREILYVCEVLYYCGDQHHLEAIKDKQQHRTSQTFDMRYYLFIFNILLYLKKARASFIIKFFYLFSSKTITLSQSIIFTVPLESFLTPN